MNADANVSGEGAKGRAEAELSETDHSGDEMTRRSLAAPGSSAAASNVGSNRVLLGARHDLQLDAGKATASCQCLSVALGNAQSPGMAWSTDPPVIDAGTQLSIALSSAGQACKDEPKKSLGASYWGYRISGDNVVVLVEAARDGRPLTNGAIIPKPVGQGQVFVAPASKKLPYGRALAGDDKGLCKIGNPGAARTAPFSELEVGSDAPRPRSGAVNRSASEGQSSPAEDSPTTLDLPLD